MELVSSGSKNSRSDSLAAEGGEASSGRRKERVLGWWHGEGHCHGWLLLKMEGMIFIFFDIVSFSVMFVFVGIKYVGELI